MLSDQTNSYDVYRVNEPPKHYLWCLPASKKAVSFVSAALRKCAVTNRQIIAKFDKQKNTSGSAYEICKVWDLKSDLAFQIAKRFKDIDAARFSDAPLMSHNQYCVKKETQHYIWGEAPQEETLVDRVCAGAAFLLCIAVLMFLG